MRFKLYCGGDPRKLGIEDQEGDWDLVKFKEHVESCSPCKSFVCLLGADFFDTMIAAFGRIWRLKKH